MTLPLTGITLNQANTSPEHLFGPLFVDVQMSRIFGDSKTFADCIPNKDSAWIIESYIYEKNRDGFDLKQFVLDNFTMPYVVPINYSDDNRLPIRQHIDRLWSLLARQPQDQIRGGSLIPLPEPYVVPGGRFREIYYWDSYFTMLGLKESGRSDLIENMIHNFVYLIDYYGHIPTANRTYYLSRSQPPFFSLMVRLFSEMEGKKVLKRYLPQMQQEYNYWMDGAENLTEPYTAYRRVVMLPNGTYLNRYWDDQATPRPESYHEDIESAQQAFERYGTAPESIYRCIRAAAESGWDFSSRWLSDGKTFDTIQTTNIIPVDLNCLMFHMESTLAEAYYLSNQYELYRRYEQKARKRQAAIKNLFWDSKNRFFMDYNFDQRKLTKSFTLAGTFPLFFNLADHKQARFINAYVRLNFMSSGGVLTTLSETGQQWDIPNGWAPLQWIVYKGLLNYNFTQSAERLRSNWLHLVEKQYYATGKLLEKYNVANTNLVAGGGEYEIQEGFGWTNGVYLKMKKQKVKNL